MADRDEYYKQVHPLLTLCAFVPALVFSLFVVIRLSTWGTCLSADPLHRICLFSAFPILDLPRSGENQACSCMQIWYEDGGVNENDVVNRTRCNNSVNVARRHEFASIAATSQYASTILIGYKCNETVPIVNTLFATMQHASVLIVDGPFREISGGRDVYVQSPGYDRRRILSRFDDAFLSPGYALQERVEFKRLQDVTTLKVLMLMRLELDSIEWLPSMVQLREFKIFGAPLVALPRSTIATMTQLDKFSVLSTKLSALPSTVDYFPTILSELKFEGNTLTELPSSLGRLTRLIELDVSANLLSGTMPWIASLTDMKKLILSNNALRSIASELEHLGKLTRYAFLHTRVCVLNISRCPTVPFIS